MSSTASLLSVPLPGTPAALQIAQSAQTRVRLIRVPRASAVAALMLPELQQAGLFLLVGEHHGLRRFGVSLNIANPLSRLLAAEVAVAAAWEAALLISVAFRALSSAELAYLRDGVQELLQLAHGETPRARDRSQADLEAILTELPDLCALVGEGILTAHALSLRPGDLLSGEEVYFCELPGVFAMGRLEIGGFRVLKGARALRAGAAQVQPLALQQGLIERGVLDPVPESAQHLQFTQDHLFATQALAATAVLGRSSTGFFDWKRADGSPIGEILRAHSLT